MYKNKKAKPVGCWSHARRKFFKITKATKKKGLAHEALEQIGALYHIESQAKEKNLQPQAVWEVRQEKSVPLIDEFKNWLERYIKQVPPKSPIGKAIQYCLNQWKKLLGYLEDGRLEMDNNRTERKVKPFVIGRKNWLFHDSVAGAKAGSIIFSVIETCKEHQVEPYAYLRYVLSELPKCDPNKPEQLISLLPFNVSQETIAAQWQSIPDL